MKAECISGVGAGMQPWPAEREDAESKGIRAQIQEKQKELQKLSEDENMSPDEKMKRRQKLQQEIADLNAQLRMHQMEQHTKAKEKKSSAENGQKEEQDASGRAGGGKRGQNEGLSTSSMQAMISADCGVKQAKVQGSVATQMEDRAEVLKAEIKLDSAYGTSTARKEEELAGITEKAQQAQAAQMKTLGEANRVMQEAEKEEQAAKEQVEKEPTGKEREAERSGDAKESGKEESEKGTHVDVRV